MTLENTVKFGEDSLNECFIPVVYMSLGDLIHLCDKIQGVVLDLKVPKNRFWKYHFHYKIRREKWALVTSATNIKPSPLPFTPRFYTHVTLSGRKQRICPLTGQDCPPVPSTPPVPAAVTVKSPCFYLTLQHLGDDHITHTLCRGPK